LSDKKELIKMATTITFMIIFTFLVEGDFWFHTLGECEGEQLLVSSNPN
jgi:hypothetical protein